jgi:hypothetical protein
MTRHKDGGDGEQIVRQFSGVICLFILTVNHELRASLLEDKLQEFDSVSTQPVLVHNHNLLDHSSEHAFQKGEKTFALEVETGSDV